MILGTILGNHLGVFCLLASGLTGTILTPVMIVLARQWGLVDLPGARKVHRHPIPRIGGFAIAIAAVLPIAIIAIFKGDVFGPGGQADGQTGLMITMMVASLMVMATGLLDDVLNIPAKYKLIVLVAASCVFCESGGVVREFIFQQHTVFKLGMSSWPLTILWIVGVTVSINFIDGLDGLAAGVVAMACAMMATSALLCGVGAYALVPLALLGALLGFLLFNFNPAKIFMGDSGSMFIGFLFASSCVVIHNKLGTTRGIFLPCLALAIPIFDTFFTMVRRGIVQRRSLFSAERGHIHHRLLDIGLCHRHVVLLLYAVTLLGSCCALVATLHSVATTGICAAFFCSGLIVLFRVSGTAGARSTITAIRRNRALARESKRHRLAFEELQLLFREVDSFDLWWKHICLAAQKLEFAKLDLPLERRDGTTTIFKWRRDDKDLADASSLTAEVPIPQRRTGKTLRVSAEVIVDEFLESAGQRLAMFSRLIAECSLKQLPDLGGARGAAKTAGAPEAAEQMPNPQFADITTQSPGSAGNPLSGLRIGIVHDFLYTYAGAERVLEQLIACFPDCDLFSLFDFLPENQRGFIRHKKVQTTFIQQMPWARTNHRSYLPLIPLAIEQLDLSGYDIVISSSYVAAKGVITRPDQLHICYCHTPVRYAWDLQNQYLGQVIGLARLVKNMFARMLLHYIRIWDLHSANRVDVFVTNSNFVGQRIEKIYRRESATIYPPVDTDWYSLQESKEDFYVTASRLVPYKRVDMIVEAFSRMPHRRLVVVGEGPEMAKIRAKAGDNVKLMGYQSAARLKHYFQHARAFVFAAEEDFGIVPVEAQACGTPVICYGRGGVIESVIDGKTGIHFHEQTADAIVNAVQRFEDMVWDPKEIRKNSERFSIREFRRQFAATARASWALFGSKREQRDLNGCSPGQQASAIEAPTVEEPCMEVSIRDLSGFKLKEPAREKRALVASQNRPDDAVLGDTPIAADSML
jgi:UDP-N-acetylmuramyl pentapeptide phosphotransferase/UDP-N-acetylglucosamine-1-phosphate transferase/glycosyltransferase involved in cell wall biosynthesis